MPCFWLSLVLYLSQVCLQILCRVCGSGAHDVCSSVSIAIWIDIFTFAILLFCFLRLGLCVVQGSVKFLSTFLNLECLIIGLLHPNLIHYPTLYLSQFGNTEGFVRFFSYCTNMASIHWDFVDRKHKDGYIS
jgi:hypothetical protein